jgi:predicted DNA-binding antitoxin AbrB/MazE fold protein
VSATVEAIYENGVLKLLHPLPLGERSPVLVTVQLDAAASSSADREAWLKLSEASLLEAWSDPADDVFNELLDR